MKQDSVEHFLSLPFTIKVIRDEGEGYSGWFAEVVELPGCMTQADTFEELGEMIEDAKRAWIEVALEDGRPIPQPRKSDEFSGKFVVRVPKSLHRELVERAEQEGVSLNAYVNMALAKATVPQQPTAQDAPEQKTGKQASQASASDDYQHKAKRRNIPPAGLAA